MLLSIFFSHLQSIGHDLGIIIHVLIAQSTMTPISSILTIYREHGDVGSVASGRHQHRNLNGERRNDNALTS